MDAILVGVKKFKPVAPSTAMALINHNHVKKTGWIIFLEKVFDFIFGIFAALKFVIERLISGNQHAGIFLRIARIHFGGISAECGLKVAQAVIPQFRPVANKQGFAERASIKHPL